MTERSTLILLLAIARFLQAADVVSDAVPIGFKAGPLVVVSKNGSLTAAPTDLPFGHPAFRDLTIRKDPENNRWVISGTVCSTNTGSPWEGAVIYAGYPDHDFRPVAMANLKGEVSFSVRPIGGADSKPRLPTDLYIAPHPIMNSSLEGVVLRKYPLRSTQISE